jgi:hypothetical protein
MEGNNQSENYYEFEFVGGVNYSYLFETINEVVFEIKFKPSDYVFEYSENINNSAFELGIVILEGGRKVGMDNKIPTTIAEIIFDFFSKKSEDVIIYICDSSDSRQLARKRKFDSWADYFKGKDYFKVDAEIIDAEKNKIYSSLILKSDNPNFRDIIKYFGSLSSTYSK